jgi:7-cyano-7-deazaguanine synthase
MTLSTQAALSPQKALILFSGGQDSATCLAWALTRFAQVETLGFDYGQRHAVELTQRPVVLQALRDAFPDWSARLGADHMLDASVIASLGSTAMTQNIAIQTEASGLPNTFVPGRNLLFLTLAGALAYRRGATHLVTGVCETDYSGYPDCRHATMQAMQQALSLGMDKPVVIETPLMWLSKAATWQMAHELGGAALQHIITEHSHTCYLGNREQRHAWGWGCGTCPACELRAKGWAQYSANKGTSNSV